MKPLLQIEDVANTEQRLGERIDDGIEAAGFKNGDNEFHLRISVCCKCEGTFVGAFVNDSWDPGCDLMQAWRGPERANVQSLEPQRRRPAGHRGASPPPPKQPRQTLG